MGRNEWESGNITLSTSDFPKFRKILVDALNARQVFLFDQAKTLHADLVATHAAEKDQPLSARLRQRLNRLLAPPPAPSGNWYVPSFSPRPTLTHDEAWAIEQALISRPASQRQDPHLLHRPTRDQFPVRELPPVGDPSRALVRAQNQVQNQLFVQAKNLHFTWTSDPANLKFDRPVLERVRQLVSAHRSAWEGIPGATEQVLRSLVKEKPASLQRPSEKSFPRHKSNATQFSNSEAHLSLDPATRQIKWSVDRAKNAVRDAWDSLLGITFNQALGQMTWTRATGGTFWGGNEYDEDYDRENGPGEGSSVTRRFGPLGQQDLSAAVRQVVIKKSATRLR